MSAKRIVIIGSGLGGLSCGVILSKNGYDVTVLEQGAQIGGCLQCFSRRGAKFETGMHFIGSALPGQTMHKMIRYLGLGENVKLSRLDPDGYNVISLGDSDIFRIPNGRDAFIDRLSGIFPQERENLVRYFEMVESVAGASQLVSGSGSVANSVAQAEYQQRSIDDVLGSVTRNSLLAKVLVGDMPLYAAERGRTPFATHAFIADFYNQSAFRIVGGSDIVARQMAKAITDNGGKVKAGCKVTKILCDETRATGVQINGDYVVEGDYVISDTHPDITLSLLDTKMIRPAFRHRITSLRQTTGCFAVYLHFKEGMVKYMNHNHFHYFTDRNDSAPWDCEMYTQSDWPRNYLYMHFCDEERPSHAKAGVILAYMRMEEVDRWVGTSVGQRGTDYDEFKRIKAETLLSLAAKQHPELANGIKHYYTSTPLTYADYTGSTGGSMYGVAKDVSLGAGGRVPHKTKVPNVFQTGQNINSHGMLGVLVGALVTCRELVPQDTLSRQIWEAQ